MRDTIAHTIASQLPFSPNPEQEQLIHLWADFLVSRDPRRCFLLRGYAGTGKTSLVGALVRTFVSLRVPCRLLAPTGRAAKVMARYSGQPASTIHRAIYRQATDGSFALAPNMQKRCVYIVDEASMISAERDNPLFGSGCLLDDLVRFVYSAPHSYLILVGDDAQLPPVGQSASRALSASYMSGYGLNVTEHVLTTVARQALDSAVLANATLIRSSETLPELRFAPDFVSLMPNLVSAAIEQSYAEVGVEETLIITRSNRRMNLYNNGVRSQVLWREELLSNDDRIMVCRNCYYDPDATGDAEADSERDTFIANGEMFRIRRLRNEREMYGFRFVDAELTGIDRDFEIARTLWLDTLTTERPEENLDLQQTLFSRIAEDYPEVRNKRKLAELVKESPYYNALQIRHAYAITCHKAQGGQWRHVYIDVPLTDVSPRWLYTAVTRATERVYWVASPEPAKTN